MRFKTIAIPAFVALLLMLSKNCLAAQNPDDFRTYLNTKFETLKDMQTATDKSVKDLADKFEIYQKECQKDEKAQDARIFANTMTLDNIKQWLAILFGSGTATGSGATYGLLTLYNRNKRKKLEAE